MNAFLMTDKQILELGFEALVDKLGPVGMVRFIHQFEAGIGNFTEDRRQWVGVSDAETLAKQIQQAENDTGYTFNALSPVIEQTSDDADNLVARGWSDLQESEGTTFDLAAEDIEMNDSSSFRIGGQIQRFATSIAG